MHESVMDYVRRVARAYHLNEPDYRVLECGSLNENGSIRSLFNGVKAYLGIDIREGRDVDEVANVEALPFEDDHFEVVACVETMEHVLRPWRAMEEMGRVLAPGGHLVLTTRGPGFPVHRYPVDTYRYTPDSMPLLVEECAGLTLVELSEDPEFPGVFALGRKVIL